MVTLQYYSNMENIKSIIVDKEVFTDEWNVGHMTLSPVHTEFLEDTKEVFYTELVIEEDMTFNIEHPVEGRKEVTILKGTYKPPFVTEQ